MRNFLVKEWNLIDTICYKLDYAVSKVKTTLMYEEPDVESIIEAETNHLKAENDLLKELQYPKKVEKEDKNYLCPNRKCRKEIAGILVERYRIKYCPECGQRIYLNNYSGATGKK